MKNIIYLFTMIILFESCNKTQTPAPVVPILASITTTAASAITSTTATSGGNISSDGGATVTARGVCWNTSTGPTIANSKTTDGTGTGIFASSVTGLTTGTTYYIRAYATNSAGAAYGNEITITTGATLATIITTAISAITQTTATSGGNITNNGGAAITARGVCWNTSTGPTTANSKTIDGTGTGTFASSVTGLTAGTIYYVRAYATNSAGTAYGNEVSFITQQTINTFTDPRDGQVYTFMQIGSQIWMTQNLNYNTAGSWCFANNTINCSIYGRLYNWNTALTVAPPGWHLPSDVEWTTLTDFLGGVTVAGGAMKETGTTHWLAPNTAATNSSGFTGLPGGYIYNGSFDNLGYYAYWWSSTGVAGASTYTRYLFNQDGTIGRGNNFNRSNDGQSVRCIKD